MLRLRGIAFRHAFTLPGARGFFGEGYRHHRIPPWSWADPSGSTCFFKTTTFAPRMGNMPLRGDDGVTPVESVPRCIIVKPFGGHVLNAVGLSGPGAHALLATRKWQEWPEPFFLSFMAVGPTPEERRDEWVRYTNLIAASSRSFRSKFGIAINLACPNTGHDVRELVREAGDMLRIGERLDVPLVVGINLLVSPETAAEISRHPACDAVLQANSVPWGAFPERIPWKKIFGSAESPLSRRGYGAGGYSGPYALPILVQWLHEARFAKFAKPIIAGGGIQSVEDAETVMRVGYPVMRGVGLGIVGLVRPWRLQRIIRHVNGWYVDRTERKGDDR